MKPIPANGLVKEAPVFYDVKPSQAKGATPEVSASCYKTHLGKFSEEASPELNEEHDQVYLKPNLPAKSGSASYALKICLSLKNRTKALTSRIRIS